MNRLLAILLLLPWPALATLEVGGRVNLAWNPPVAIPRPAFGITNSVWQYSAYFGSKTFDYGSGAEAYRTNVHGPFTQIVNKYHGSATDTPQMGEPTPRWGTEAVPRVTVKRPLLEGEVVQLYGSGNRDENPYAYNDSGPGNAIWWDATATQSNPAFIRGISTNLQDMPWIRGEISPAGDWLIVENIAFTNSSASARSDLKNAPVISVAIRDFYVTGTGSDSDSNFLGFPGSSPTADEYAQDIVIWNFLSEDIGDHTTTTQTDELTVLASQFATNIWVLDATILRSGGDAIRFGRNIEGTEFEAQCRFMFAGRINTYTNKENAIDIKKVKDWVLSQIDCKGFFGVPSDPGAAIVVHYYPTNGWIVNCNISQAVRGVQFSSQGDSDLFLIGNRIHGILAGGHALYEDNGGGTFYNFNNTIWGAPDGITSGGPIDAMHNRNNIVVDQDGFYLEIAGSGERAVSTVQNDLYWESGGGAVSISWGTTYTTAAAFDAAVAAASGVLEADPLFVDAVNGDFRLQAGSPAIAAGVDWRATATSAWNTQFSAQFGQTMTDDDWVDANGNPFGATPNLGALQGEADDPPPGVPSIQRVRVFALP